MPTGSDKEKTNETSRRHDPEVQAITDQFQKLSRQAHSLVGEIEATITMLELYQENRSVTINGTEGGHCHDHWRNV